ncbi:MAG: protein kinase [Micrococcales bacterium]|nr:protein kinase [Micrococcales bacterium]
MSQWLQQRRGSVVRGSLVRLTPSGLLQVSGALDSHPVRVLLPVLRGGQAAVARAVLDGTEGGTELALRVQAVSSQAERVRQMERLVTMLTVAEATRADPARYPAVLPVLESFVVTLPGDQVPVAAPAAQYELWCDVMPWCPTNLAQARRDATATAVDWTPSVALARMLPLVRTVQAVHEHLNVVHRDITPNNVLVDAAGRLLLADWGIAHTVASDQTSTRTELVGNRGFSLPPEMLAGDTAVGRYTDAWYLGCLLVWMLTGQAPGPRHGPDLLPDGLPSGRAAPYLDEVVRGLCEPDPRRRTGLADAASRLDRLRLAGPSDWGPPRPAPPRQPDVPLPDTRQLQPAAAQPPSPAPLARDRPRRWPRWLAAAVGVVILATAGVVVWQRADRDAADADAVTSSCWDDLEAASRTGQQRKEAWPVRCPDLKAAVLFDTFPLKAGVPDPECFEYDIAIGADPGFQGSSWLVSCEWPDEGLAVQLGWFRDVQASVAHYQRHGYDQDAADAPRLVDGPVGPVFSRAHGQTMNVAYCYEDLPVCMEVSGTPATIARTADRFEALTSDQIQLANELLDAAQ